MTNHTELRRICEAKMAKAAHLELISLATTIIALLDEIDALEVGRVISDAEIAELWRKAETEHEKEWPFAVPNRIRNSFARAIIAKMEGK